LSDFKPNFPEPHGLDLFWKEPELVAPSGLEWFSGPNAATLGVCTWLEEAAPKRATTPASERPARRRKKGFTQAQVRRLIKAAKAEGHLHPTVEARPDGGLRLLTNTPERELTALDRWEALHGV